MDSKPKCSEDWFKWIIVVCSFINQAGTIGFFMSLSVLYVSWLEEFQEVKSVTSWILSIGFLVLQGFSPVPAHLSALFGFRAVAFVGGIITCAGLVMSAYATSVFFLMVSIGFITGVGTNFCYLPSVAIVALYFEERRSLAMGISAAGAGVGAFILGPLTNFLINEYRWRGATLILGAISLNMCVTGLLFRPVEDRIRTNFEEEYKVTDSEETEKGGKYEEADETDPMMEPKFEGVPSIKVDLVEEDVTGGGARQRGSHDSSHSLILKGVLLKNFLAAEGNNAHVHTSLNELRPKRQVAPNVHSSDPNLRFHQNGIGNKRSSHESLIRSIQNVDVALLASVCGSRLLLNGNDGALQHQQQKPKYLEEQEGHREPNDSSGPQESWFSRLLHHPAIKNNMDLLRDPTFFIFCIINFLTCLSFFTPVLYLVDRAVHHGIDKSIGAILISASGCGNIMGRLFTGFVADWCSYNRMLMFSICLIIQGVGTMLSSLCGDIAILHGIYATFFGFHMGIYATLLTMVTVDLQGVENVATAYGLVLVFLGLGSLLGAPISGSLFDWSRSYVLSYVVNGIFLVISGGMLIPTACRTRKEKFAV